MSNKKHPYQKEKGSHGDSGFNKRRKIGTRRPLNRYELETPSLGNSFSTNVVICKKCKSDIKFTESSERGLGFKLVISCNNCAGIGIPSCPFIKKLYDINRRLVLAMRLLGAGLNGIIKFCAVMDLPRPIFQSFYDKIVKKIAKGAEVVAKSSMSLAAEKEKKLTVINVGFDENDLETIQISSDKSITVSGDASFMG
ncbi:hypothetical protein TKK_0002903 [Trichogramma kaykai]